MPWEFLKLFLIPQWLWRKHFTSILVMPPILINTWALLIKRTALSRLSRDKFPNTASLQICQRWEAQDTHPLSTVTWPTKDKVQSIGFPQLLFREERKLPFIEDMLSSPLGRICIVVQWKKNPYKVLKLYQLPFPWSGFVISSYSCFGKNQASVSLCIEC